MKEKPCNKCELTLPLTGFYKKKAGRFGVDSICKSCTKKHKRQTYKIKKKTTNKQPPVREFNLKTVFVDSHSKQANDALLLLLASIKNHQLNQGGVYE